MTDLTIYDEETFQEIKKCKESPYYFATNYLIVDGRKFITTLSEKQFNELCEKVASGKHIIVGRNRRSLQ